MLLQVILLPTHGFFKYRRGSGFQRRYGLKVSRMGVEKTGKIKGLPIITKDCSEGDNCPLTLKISG